MRPSFPTMGFPTDGESRVIRKEKLAGCRERCRVVSKEEFQMRSMGQATGKPRVSVGRAGHEGPGTVPTWEEECWVLRPVSAPSPLHRGVNTRGDQAPGAENKRTGCFTPSGEETGPPK